MGLSKHWKNTKQIFSIILKVEKIVDLLKGLIIKLKYSKGDAMAYQKLSHFFKDCSWISWGIRCSHNNPRKYGRDFIFYLGKSKKGRIVPKVKSCGKRMSSKLKKVNDWCKYIRNKHKLPVIWKIFCSKLRGHIQYYGVTFNSKAVSNFIHQAVKIMFKWMNRRSQKKSFTWDKFYLFIERNPLPKAKIYHTLMKKTVWTEISWAYCGNSARWVVCPAKAGLFNGS